jgi:hypothetical protein
MSRSLMLILSGVAAIVSFAQRGRYMPPSAVECDRNSLTSHTGEVTRYSRKAGRIVLTLKTDADTVETVSLRPGDKVLLNAQPIKHDDWKKVEEKEGSLRHGMRATVWICQGGRPVLDWQPPPQ